MRFVDEYRDPAAARALVARVTELAGDGHYKFMEVCGGHTHTIYRHGIEHLLPTSVELVHGPGCPVCVIPMGRIDDAISVAQAPGVIFTSFGDMMRVPGSTRQSARCQSAGGGRPDRLLATRRAPGRRRQSGAARRVLRRGLRDHFTLDGGNRAEGEAGRGHELQRLLEPRDDRAPDQGHPRFPRPPPRRVHRAGSRVDGRRPAPLPFRPGGVRQAARDGRLRAARHPPGDTRCC